MVFISVTAEVPTHPTSVAFEIVFLLLLVLALYSSPKGFVKARFPTFLRSRESEPQTSQNSNRIALAIVDLFSGAEPTITLLASIFPSVIQENQRSLEAHSFVSGKDGAGYFAIGILL